MLLKRIGYRLLDIGRWLPKRAQRLYAHLLRGMGRVLGGKGITARSISAWWLDTIFLLWDLVGLSELYEIIADVVKFKSQSLNKREIALAQSIFGDTLPYYRITIDRAALAGPKQGRFCYVSFCIVNSWGEMRDDTLIHELVHVWQYHHFGSVYIPQALAAQRSAAGYDYGGVATLKHQLNQGGLLAFNREQQADIIADYFRLVQGARPCWGTAGVADVPVYERYVRQLRSIAEK